MKINKNKKIFIILSTCLIMLTTPKVKSSTNYNIKYNSAYEANDVYASFNDSNIYIGDKEYIESIRDDRTKDMYIIDDRKNINPNMAICNSYEITDIELMKNIIDILLEYEKDYPSNWNRTKKSMLIEWIIHNYCYNLSFKRESTEKVDFDNNDEKKYSFIK